MPIVLCEISLTYSLPKVGWEACMYSLHPGVRKLKEELLPVIQLHHITVKLIHYTEPIQSIFNFHLQFSSDIH